MHNQQVTGKDNEDKGRTSKVGQGQDSKAGQWAGWARQVNGQDGQGQFTGWTNVVINGLDDKKLDANSSGLSPGLDTRTTNGTAKSEVILSGYLDYKQAQSLDSPRMRATLSTLTARPGCQRPSNGIHGQD